MMTFNGTNFFKYTGWWSEMWWSGQTTDLEWRNPGHYGEPGYGVTGHMGNLKTAHIHICLSIRASRVGSSRED